MTNVVLRWSLVVREGEFQLNLKTKFGKAAAKASCVCSAYKALQTLLSIRIAQVQKGWSRHFIVVNFRLLSKGLTCFRRL